MKQLSENTWRFSPRDLIAWLEGDFAAWCDRHYAGVPTGGSDASANRSTFRPDERSEEVELIKRRGVEHEGAYVTALRQREPGVVEITRSADVHDDAAFHGTLEAMRAGAPIIYQGELRSGAWMGISDFLHRRDGPSTLGDHFYEPWDTKLARTAKPYFLVQLCAYAELLEDMQGHRPATFGFVLGDNSEVEFETADIWHYYRRLRESFETFHADWSADNQPDPGLERSYGRWSEYAERLLRARDDLSLIAGVARSQIIRLREGGLDTVAKLAAHTGSPVRRMSETTFNNLHAQAEMQVRTREAGHIVWRFRDTDPDRPRRGLALLPAASPNDVFFDIEGFPYAVNGLEYLLGVVTTNKETTEFRDWWAHDDVQEQRAFEAFVDWAYARWTSDPTLHIYHYASYERSALCRLMSRYGTRELEVDELLRHNVLVDLYPIVLQGMVIGTEGYSLKDIEHLYMPPRPGGGVTTAGGSVVAYQNWMDAGESQEYSASPILKAIREYNKIDCESTVALRDWLLERQHEAGIAFVPAEPPKPAASEESPATTLANTLLARADETAVDAETRRITQLLAWLLEFHRREEKPFWWKHFELVDATEKQLFDDTEALAGLERTATPATKIKKSSGLEYRFDPDQETKLRAESDCVLAGTAGVKCAIERFVDRDAGLVEIKIGPGKSLPSHMSLIPGQPIATKTMRDALLRYVTTWSNDTSYGAAVLDLLHRRTPRLTLGRTFHIDESSELTPQAIDVVRHLDRSTLCIQGPPGTGKTTIAAEMILAHMADGKRVGIVANNHDVVLNLMDCIACRADELGVAPRLVKVGGDDAHALMKSGRIEWIESKAAANVIAGGALVIGGTAWLFSRAELDGMLEYLYVEEAGQFSLANTVAVAQSARNLVLLGDQMQLSQPTQGSHPGESGRSALLYLLQDHATVPRDLGIFLGRSYRMHPDVCRIISDAYYEGRLQSAPSTREHRIVGGSSTSVGLEAGVRFMPVGHEGCTQDSDEEVCAIQSLVKELLECRVAVKGRPERNMTVNDILIVAPFNAQVRALKLRLPGARVGTVDKFQGQEAPVVIVSMCASTIHDAPRGPKFLLEKNRLNVAISRAQALAIVVGSPALGSARARSIEEMYLLSGWCRIAEQVASYAGEAASG